MKQLKGQLRFVDSGRSRLNIAMPEKAVRILGGNSGQSDSPVAVKDQQRIIQENTDPSLVTNGSWKFWSPEARMRREAVKTALEARLTIFRDNIEAVRTTNRVLNNAAIIAVMTSAEEFIMEVRSLSETQKQDTLFRAQDQLLAVLNNHLNDLEVRQMQGMPEQIIELRVANAINEYAERSAKIAGLDFEFDKKRLLSLQ
ncbi:MAG TPA: hypothetical protein VFC63_12970 [Blastocatellia bacterium]|nr:hypothetical protein [Blastocatellia bacterium]